MIIQRKDGKTYDIDDFGLRVVKFKHSSPSFETTREKIEGRNGEINLGTRTGTRKINVEFKMRAVDHYDYALLRNEIFNLFNSEESFYIIEKIEPGKRWLVEVEPYDLAQINFQSANIEMPFVVSSGYAESIGTTQDSLTFDSGLWQIGQGLIAEDLIYNQTTSIFRIYNAGDITIDPRNLPLLITFKGASANLKIRNKTTGDEWLYNGTTTSNDIIRLDRIRSTKNSLSIFRDTNRKLISIKPGWNDFEITGATSPFSISFDFRFYYL
ncbi:phage tail family protein [Bacillus sp. BP-3]|uniref:phage tail family protein n=1 Tax=Bacillus sp. BP-3 TaxID=3022773 RepID=UPI002FEDEFEA